MSNFNNFIKNKITKGAIGTFALNICNQIFLFLILMVLARFMSPENFGIYSVVLSSITLISLPFLGGFTTFIMRYVAEYNAKKELSKLSGVLKYGVLWVLFGSVVFILILYYLMPFFIKNNVDVYNWGLPIILLMPLLLLFGAILRGLKKVIQGRFSEFFLQPLLFLILIIFFSLFHIENNLNPITVLQFYSASIAISIIISMLLAYRNLPKNLFKENSVIKYKEWLKSSIPLIFAVGLVIINMNIDIIMVGSLAGEEQAGQYRVASRMAGFVLFILFAVNNSVAPYISSLYATNQKIKLQKTITLLARTTLTITVPIVLILIVFSKQILGIIFGEGFIVASSSLVILSFANLFSVAMGQVGQVMSLTGYEKYAAYSVFIGVIVNISLNFILVPKMGINGAAIATGVSIIIWNLILSFWTSRKTGLYCTALGPIRKRPV